MSGGKDEQIGGPIGVVEESDDDIYSVKFILQSLGYSVECFSFTRPYLEGLIDLSPKLIIVDMMISDGGGYEVIRILKQSSLKKVPILAITADAMTGSDKEVLEAGGQDLLGKPYAVAELRKKLKKWL